MSSIDDVIRESLAGPENETERDAALTAARTRLTALMENHEPASRQGTERWGQRIALGARFIPAVAVCALVVVICAGAVLFIHGRPAPRSSAAPAASPAGLISRLAVLRRPQTTADQLPARVTEHWGRLGEQTQAGALVPGLSRLVYSRAQVAVYLVVVKPVGGPYHLWTPSDGDEATLVAVTPTSVTATEAIPAQGLTDADIIGIIGVSDPFSGAPDHGVPYLVSVVPDGVTTARWQYRTRGVSHLETAGRSIDVAVHDNVALLPCTDRAMAAYSDISPTWFAADGQRIPTNERLIDQALAASQERRFRQTLTTVRAERHSASPQILKAFAVFSFDSPTGTRLADGLVISKPALNQIPLGVLGLGQRMGSRTPDLDFRQTREIRDPSGVSIYILPGRNRLCVFTTGVFETHDFPDQAAGAAGGCDPTLPALLLHGSGGSSGGHTVQLNYGIVPIAHPALTIVVRGGRRRRIRPEAGVYIVRS